MEVGDVAAWFAAGVAIIAAVIAMSNANSAKTQAGAALKQAREAELARIAAEESAAEARKANEFIREKDAREQAEREASAVAEASKVLVERTAGGGLKINITNHSLGTIFSTRLESVVPTQDPSYQWRYEPRVLSNRREVEKVLNAGEGKRWFVEFVSRTGETKPMVGNTYDVTFSFTDGGGQRWRRTNDNTPERVSTDIDDNSPHPSQAATTATEEDVRLQLLSLIVDRERNDTPIDISLLHVELGLDEVLVQRCLAQLHKDSMIIALTGDDGIAAVGGPTPGGTRYIEGLGL